MIILMQRLFVILFFAAFVSSCGSGATTSKAGGAGTNTGNTGLLLFASIEPAESHWPLTNAGNGCDVALGAEPLTPGTHLAQLTPETSLTAVTAEITFTLQDPRGTYAFPFQPQGVTFDSYTVTYQSVSPGAPQLSQRNFRSITANISLNGSTDPVTVTDQVIVMDTATLREWLSVDSRSPDTYALTIQYRGHDFVNGEPINLVVRHQVVLSAPCEETTEEVVEAA